MDNIAGLLNYSPAANMGGDTFVLAAQRFGLPDDINTLNKIVNLVNKGLTPDQAAESIAKSAVSGEKFTEKLDGLVKQRISQKMPFGLLSSISGS